MPITLVDSVTNGESGVGTTPAMDTTAANLIVKGIAGPATAYCNGADSETNTWDDTGQQTDNPGSAASGIPHVINPATDASHTFSSTLNIFYQGIVAAAFAGVDVLDQAAQGVSNTSSGTSHPTSTSGGAMTPTVDGCLLVSVLQIGNGAGVVTPPTGFSILEFTGPSNNMRVILAYEIQTTATARTPTWTSASANTSCGATKIFRPAAGGGGGNPHRTLSLLGVG